MILTTRQGDRLFRIDRNDVLIREDEVMLFSCVRNEAIRLPYFLAYYRDLGVSRFIFIDNDSTDGTDALLLAHADVHVFRTPRSYAGSHYGVDWLNCLLEHFGCDRWVLVMDADELLVYPDSEFVRLPALVRQLERDGFDGLLTFLLDMYSDGPIRDARYTPGAPFVGTCPFFDSNSYTFGAEGLRATIPARGGARQRVFWKPGCEHRGKPPFLQKIPFLKWAHGRAFRASTHLIQGIRLAPTTGVLLHFKLFADFVRTTMIEAARGEHWDGAAQYAVYAEALAADPGLNPMYDGSVRFRGSRQLIDMGLIREP